MPDHYDPYRLTPFTWLDHVSSKSATLSDLHENSLPNYLGMQASNTKA